VRRAADGVAAVQNLRDRNAEFRRFVAEMGTIAPTQSHVACVRWVVHACERGARCVDWGFICFNLVSTRSDLLDRSAVACTWMRPPGAPCAAPCPPGYSHGRRL
jgi:hypothetical protein